MLFAAFILGLVNSLHCLGMCGPLHLAATLHSGNNQSVLSATFYHLGRILTYSILGIFFGVVGFGFKLAGIQQYLSILSGIMILAFVFIGTSKIESTLYLPFKNFFANLLHTINKQTLPFFKIGAGVINGFLPCGLVYMALLGSLAMQQALQGGIFMLVFGMGTLPVFATLTYLPKPFTAGKSFRTATQIAGVVLGILLILRGLGLGIPYVSPAIQNQHTVDSICAPAH